MCLKVSLHRLLLLMLIILSYSCKKTNSPDNNPAPNYIPAVTPVGIPVDNPVSKTIGSSGGSLASSDGKIELNIPAGALGSNTSISIQPVTNEAPGGIGLSYHLMPDGTKFAKPVTLTYHYTDQEINGTLPYLLYIAYQDSLFQWKADFKKRNVDTVAKTISLGINHFSIWSMGDRFYIIAFPDMLRKNETSTLRAIFQSPPESTSGSDDDLPPLPQTTNLGDKEVSNWKVNGKTAGNSQDGTISGSGSQVTYTAPATIDKSRTVQVSVEVNRTVSFFNNGKLVSSVNKLILFKDLTLQPDFKFQLHVEYNKTFLGTISSLYIDSANMDITVQGNVATVTNITNYPLSISPNPVQMGACVMTYLPGPNGMVNIKGGSGYAGTVNNQTILSISLSESECSEAGFDFKCPAGGVSQHVDPKPSPAFLAGINFILDNTAQTIVDDQNGQEKMIYRLTPR